MCAPLCRLSKTQSPSQKCDQIYIIEWFAKSPELILDSQLNMGNLCSQTAAARHISAYSDFHHRITTVFNAALSESSSSQATITAIQPCPSEHRDFFRLFWLYYLWYYSASDIWMNFAHISERLRFSQVLFLLVVKCSSISSLLVPLTFHTFRCRCPNFFVMCCRH